MTRNHEDLTLTTVVHFRRLPDGAYRWMHGLMRGWYRLMDVRDPRASMNCTSRNVIRIRAETKPGIVGVTRRSTYYLGGIASEYHARADALNDARVAEWNRRTHRAE